MSNNIAKSDLNKNIIDFIKNNFNKQLLFTHSLHPTNILLYEIWRSILNFINIDIDDYNYNLNTGNIINCWYNPFTTKMIKDLDINFEYIISDDFYINRYNDNKNNYIENHNICNKYDVFL